MSGLPSPTGFTQTTGLSTGLGFSLGYGLAFQGFATWTPALLFAAGEPGAWYDPSDFTTMFQDSTGVTPVTAVEQPVGLILDKSKGLVLGAELVTNGDFAAGATGWTLEAAWSVSGGTANYTTGAATSIYQSMTLLAGKSYKVTFDITARTGSAAVQATASGIETSGDFTSVGTKTCILRPAATRSLILFFASGAGTLSIDNISVKLIDGNHATQATAASRPVLSARVNLLTYSEQFNQAAVWQPVEATVTANATTAPDGTLTADLLAATVVSAGHFVFNNAFSASNGTFSISAKPAGYNWLSVGIQGIGTAWFNVSSGTVGTVQAGLTAAISLSSNGFYRCTVQYTAAATRVNVNVSNIDNQVGPWSGDGTSGIYIWGADLRVTNVGTNMPAYQRVGAATYGTSTVAGNPDYDTSGFPFFLAFDGTARSMTSSTITPGVDKAQVFAGVRKLSDATIGCIAEFSANWSTNAGSLTLLASANDAGAAGAFYKFGSTGTGGVNAQVIASPYVAPITSTITGTSDIVGDLITARISAVAAPNATGDQGTGNFLAYPLYIGARAGSSLYYNGNLYELIVRFGSNLPEATIDNAEVWVGNKTGLDLSYATQQTIYDRFNATVFDRASATILQRY